MDCRSPHGERGLKFSAARRPSPELASLPSRGAWIEILVSRCALQTFQPSLPPRGAWIEIAGPPPCARCSAVAPLTGSVD